ncbi:trehalose-phosphatase [Pigmentiphaga sp. H8]|uniref:trehalose-phosphatase n=1 Tax=Pigmentiphaga sp. H8 TaxID=2488560 RepID=UPI000F5B7F5A|nr:trehalose-phosphatase [Pigmentiphaga sp. H8]AZG08936.1 trehalose-phosphatase [Pigmentiphaga sp. H8]
MEARTPRPPDLARCALFLDLDGTLAPIAPSPDAARVPGATVALLRRLVCATGGALAVVSGRSIEVIDRLLQPLRLPVAGLHGAQWRGPGSQAWELPVDRDRAARLLARLRDIAAGQAGIYVEDKDISFAIHYRHAPREEARIRAEVAAAAADFASDYTLQFGKMVAEVKPRGVDKGSAVERFMAVAPFASRLPVMAGDDLTDEAAFAVVARLGGIAIKIGDGDTSAPWQLPDPDALARWLDDLSARGPSGPPRHE